MKRTKIVKMEVQITNWPGADTSESSLQTGNFIHSTIPKCPVCGMPLATEKGTGGKLLYKCINEKCGYAEPIGYIPGFCPKEKNHLWRPRTA